MRSLLYGMFFYDTEFTSRICLGEQILSMSFPPVAQEDRNLWEGSRRWTKCHS